MNSGRRLAPPSLRLWRLPPSPGVSIAAPVECTGPLKQCAIEVGAFCEIENGKMMLWYKEREGAVMRFEQCVGKVYEAHGRPNPYRPAPAQRKRPALPLR